MEKEEKLKGLKTMHGEGDYSCTSPQEEIKKLRDEYESLKPITDERIWEILKPKYGYSIDSPNYIEPYRLLYFAVKNPKFNPETYIEGDDRKLNELKIYPCLIKNSIKCKPCILTAVINDDYRTYYTQPNFDKIKGFISEVNKCGLEVVDISIGHRNKPLDYTDYDEEKDYDYNEIVKQAKKENGEGDYSYTPSLEKTEQEDNLENAEEVIDGTKYDFLQIIHRLISIKDSINELRKKYCPDSDYDFPAIVNEKGNKISIDDGIWLIKVFEEITDYLLDYENELYRALDKNEKLRDMNYRYLKGVITSANLSFHSFTDSFKNWDDVEREERREPIRKYIKDYVAYLDESKERAEKGFDIVFGEKLN